MRIALLSQTAMSTRDPSVAELLELRLRLRGRPEALRFVDRALVLVARAEAAEAANRLDELAAVQRELAALGDDLALRFGAPRDRVLQ